MSYCRWSSDDFQCDLYCYEHVYGGYTTHVATNRIDGTLTPLPDARSDGFMYALSKQREELKSMEHKPIGLEYDGETFHDDDLEGFLRTVTMLKEAGYNVPDYVFERIRAEMQEHDLNTCPNCGGQADNGHDRCHPPNPYFCTKCSRSTNLDMPDFLRRGDD